MSTAGKYREQIQVLTPGPTVSDGMGGWLASGEETTMLLWARVQALPAKEDLAEGKITYRQPYKITLRYNVVITAAQRIIWQGKQISITSIQADERKTELYLYGYEYNR